MLLTLCEIRNKRCTGGVIYFPFLSFNKHGVTVGNTIPRPEPPLLGRHKAVQSHQRLGCRDTSEAEHR